MEKITKYFKYCYENDTTIEYVNTELYSMLNCSFTSEDPDYGTDTLHFTANPARPIEEMAYNMLYEVGKYLDWKDGAIDEAPGYIEYVYKDYSLSTLIAIEHALAMIASVYNEKQYYASVADASLKMAKRFIESNNVQFAFCESDSEEAKEDPRKHIDDGGWHGVKRIPGFFDNEPYEFIVAVGHYGGGNVGFGYAYNEATDATTECACAIQKAIIEATGWGKGSMIFVEEEEVDD